jgi:hypothetical protein
VFGLALAVDGLLRRRSAATRRGVWALALVVALALPVTRLGLPLTRVAVAGSTKLCSAHAVAGVCRGWWGRR